MGLKEDILKFNNMKDLFDSGNLINTIENMFQFLHQFQDRLDVENEINEAMHFSRMLIGLMREIGLQRNEVVSEQTRVKVEDGIHRFWSANAKEGKLKELIKTATARDKYLKQKIDEDKIDLDKLEKDFNVNLTFLNNQLWLIKEYIKSLEERRKYFVSIESFENRKNK